MDHRADSGVGFKHAVLVAPVAGRHLAGDVDASRHRRLAGRIPVLADASQLQLAKRGEEVGEELAHVAGGVDPLGDRAEHAIGGADARQQIGRVLNRAAEAIEAGDDKPPVAPASILLHRGVQARPVGLRARLVEVFVPFGDPVAL